jgi:CDP-glycerol glycerophosphotransferase
MIPPPNLSIIVPVYNVEKWLEECLQSIYQITDLIYEVIIINDGSTDSSYLILDKYSQKYPTITTIKTIKNGGLSNARNVGFQIASGKYISFVDSDDIVEPINYTSIFNKAISLDSDVAVANSTVFYGEKWQHTQKSNILRKYEETVNGKEFLIDYLNDKNQSLVVWNKFYKRDFLSSNKIKFIEGILHEDIPFTFSVFLHAKKVYVNDNSIYYYRKREDSIMHSINKRNAEHLLSIVREVSQEFRCLNINIKQFNDYLSYQLWRARGIAKIYDRSLTLTLLKTKLSFKKRIQCLILAFKL